jgi:uncharacterized phage-like protein YoqJ
MYSDSNFTKIIFSDSEGKLPDDSAFVPQREKTCCFTGHRPNQLPGEGRADSLGYQNLKSTVELYLQQYIRNGYDTFIIGMARGFDLMIGEILLSDDDSYGHINIVCALPYKKHIREMRTDEETDLYRSLLDRAKFVLVCREYYQYDCYKLRNQLMVECSSALLGYMKNRSARSGAMQTRNMAARNGLRITMMYGDENPQFTKLD